MLHTLKVGRLAIAVLLLCCCACAEEEPNWWSDVQPDFEWRGTYVTIAGYDRSADEACGESLRATDDRLAAMVDFHETDAPVRVEYAWMSQSAWDEIQPCPVGSACSDHGRPVSRQLAHDHELAHAVSWDLGTVCISVLEEGLAEYFAAAKPSVFEQFEFAKSIEEVLAFTASAPLRLPSEDYQQAGHFVSFLIEEYGIDAVRGLCEIIPYDADLEDWDAATSTVLSTVLADVLADYAAYPVCQHHAYRARLTDCADEPDVLVSPNEDTSFSLRIACDEPEAVGERGGMVTMVKRVHVADPGTYEVGIEGGGADMTLVLEQCAACSESPHVGRVEGPLHPPSDTACVWIHSRSECNYYDLAGTHAFIFFLPAEQVQEVTVTIRPTS
jgi:hypothetical protein